MEGLSEDNELWAEGTMQRAPPPAAGECSQPFWKQHARGLRRWLGGCKHMLSKPEGLSLNSQNPYKVGHR